MTDMTDILSAVEGSNAAFAEYKTSMDARFSSLEADADLRAAKHYNRPNNGGAHRSHDDEPQRKAFERWLHTLDPAELKSMTIGVSADGGVTVPKVIDGMIESQLLKMSPLRPYCRVVQVSTSDWHVLVSLRGLGAAWVSETAARPATTSSQFVDVKPPIGEMYSNVAISQQLMEDSQFDLSSWIAEEIAYQFSSTESDSFLNGLGAAAFQPAGILQSTFAATADGARADRVLQYVPSGVAGGLAVQTATTSPIDALINLIGALRVGYRAGSIFVMSPLTFATYCLCKDLQGRPLVTPSISADAPSSMLGFPIVLADGMPPIAAGNIPVLFGNFRRGFVIADRLGTQFLADPFTNRPYVMQYGRRRVGAAVLNSECIKGLKISVS